MARVTLFNSTREYSEADIEASRSLGQSYLNTFQVNAEYGGYMIPEGVMKNTPFWIVDDEDIDITITALSEAVFGRANPGYVFQVFKKEDLNYIDHLGRESWSVTHPAIYDSSKIN